MDDIDAISEIAGSYMQKWMALKNFKTLSMLGLKEATPTFYQQQLELAKQMGQNPLYETLINQTWYRENIDPIEAAKVVSSRQIDAAKSTVESSIIILSHTILDTALFELCNFTSLYHSERWDEDLKDKTVKFEDVALTDIQQIRQQLLCKKIEELEGKSLIVKADVLYKRCKPDANFCQQIHNNYVYDRDKLKQYDDQRHDIVHGRFNPNHQIEGFDNLLLFAEQTGMHFIIMICKHYDTVISSTKAFEFLTSTK